MNLQSSVLFLLLIAGPEQSPHLQPEFVVYQPEPNWLEVAVLLVLLAILIPTLIWLIRRMRSSASQTSMAIESNYEAIRVTQEATRVHAESIEVSRETNRLLAELNDTLRRQIDSDHETH